MNEYRDKCKKKTCHSHPEEDGHEHPHHHKDCCPSDPCLIMLRSAAKAEREAILAYLEAASLLCGDLRRLFADVAQDEMRHYMLTMRHVSSLDPVQAEAFEDEGLDDLVPRRKTPKWAQGWEPGCMCEAEEEESDAGDLAPEDDSLAVCLLTKAIAGELEAINTYQEYMAAAEDEACCRHFCHLMNDEKRHVAGFTAALYELTGEPPEMDEDEEH